MEADQRTTGRSAAQKDRRRCVGADGLGGEVRAAPDEILQYLPYRDRLVAVAGLDPGRPYGKEGGERVDVVGLGQTGAVALRRFGDRDLRAVVAVDHHDRVAGPSGCVQRVEQFGDVDGRAFNLLEIVLVDAFPVVSRVFVGTVDALAPFGDRADAAGVVEDVGGVRRQRVGEEEVPGDARGGCRARLGGNGRKEGK